ncbi:MAG: hypothetical protein IJM73_03625, partial [Spirochaetales bacterium]|nr:hypothetical protein [Spirochaetales bacterium]
MLSWFQQKTRQMQFLRENQPSGLQNAVCKADSEIQTAHCQFFREKTTQKTDVVSFSLLFFQK